MTIIQENVSLADLELWGSATDLAEEIMEAGKERFFESVIEDLYPDGISLLDLNDLLSYDTEWVYETLGMQEEEEEEDNEEEWETEAGKKYRVSGERTGLEVGAIVVAIDSSSFPYCVLEEDLQVTELSIEEIFDYKKGKLNEEYKNMATLIDTSDLEEIEE